MTWVKICGLTDAADVRAAETAGADAVGFNNIPQSPRFVAVEKIADLVTGVEIATVLLTIDLAPEDALATIRKTGVSGIQPYGRFAREVGRAAADRGFLTLFPQPAAPGLEVSDVPGIPLLDTPADERLGGTGRSFDWAIVADRVDRFVLAGGLGPDNVEEAILQTGAWGVDASSRLEVTPGQKDHSMVADFITKAKNT